MSPDHVNALFELGGALAIWGNVRRVLKDRSVKGVSPVYAAFFLVWGFWNLWFYPSLDQWASFWAGVNVAVANSVWLVLMVRYRKGPRPEKPPKGCECGPYVVRDFRGRQIHFFGCGALQ